MSLSSVPCIPVDLSTVLSSSGRSLSFAVPVCPLPHLLKPSRKKQKLTLVRRML